MLLGWATIHQQTIVHMSDTTLAYLLSQYTVTYRNSKSDLLPLSQCGSAQLCRSRFVGGVHVAVGSATMKQSAPRSPSSPPRHDTFYHHPSSLTPRPNTKSVGAPLPQLRIKVHMPSQDLLYPLPANYTTIPTPHKTCACSSPLAACESTYTLTRSTVLTAAEGSRFKSMGHTTVNTFLADWSWLPGRSIVTLTQYLM